MVRRVESVSFGILKVERVDMTSEVKELASSAGFVSASLCRVNGEGVAAVPGVGAWVGVSGRSVCDSAVEKVPGCFDGVSRKSGSDLMVDCGPGEPSNQGNLRFVVVAGVAYTPVLCAL